MVLDECAEEQRDVTQQELGRVPGIDKSNVTRLCAKMERAGHIRQRRSPSDGRARLISLTAVGGKVAKSVEQSSHRRFRQIIEAIGTERRHGVLVSLEQLNAAVSSILEPEEGVARPPLE